MLNDKFLKELERAKSNIIIVEGKKDKFSLEHLGFKRIFVIHETSVSLPKKIEQLLSLCDKKDKVCILTNFDKKGKQLYLLLKSKLQELGIKMDNTFRGLLLKEKISHIEGLSKYLRNKI